jgi:hypothetical protein
MQGRWLFCIWILAALIMAASVDATPDPPALDPHFAATKTPSATPTILPSPSGNHAANVLIQFRAQETIFVGGTEPDNPAALIAQTRQAADSSPPAHPVQSL